MYGILALGGFYELGVKTAALIKETKNIQPTIINPRFITGLDENRLDWVLENHKIVVTIEDGILSGGFGSKIAQYYSDKDIKVYNFGFSMDIPRTYEPAELMAENSLKKYFTGRLIGRHIIKCSSCVTQELFIITSDYLIDLLLLSKDCKVLRFPLHQTFLFLKDEGQYR